MIEHRVSQGELDKAYDKIGACLDHARDFKRKGAPLAGHTIAHGATNGKIEMFAQGDDLVYRWHPAPKPYDPLNDDEDESL